MFNEFVSKQFLLFLVTGGTAALINFGSRIIYSQWFDFYIAVVLAYVTGMFVAFILAKVFVFTQSDQSLYASAFFFLVVNLVGVAQTLMISLGLAYYILPFLGITVFMLEIAHGIGITVPAFTSFIGHKRLSFRKKA